jgi:FlaA1/EpsC-like NDP-sugar epimerase
MNYRISIVVTFPKIVITDACGQYLWIVDSDHNSLRASHGPGLAYRTAKFTVYIHKQFIVFLKMHQKCKNFSRIVWEYISRHNIQRIQKSVATEYIKFMEINTSSSSRIIRMETIINVTFLVHCYIISLMKKTANITHHNMRYDVLKMFPVELCTSEYHITCIRSFLSC